MKNEDFLVSSCKKMLDEEIEVERVINFLRNQGCSKTQSIVILKKTKSLPLENVKYLVHFSQTWQDRQASEPTRMTRFFSLRIFRAKCTIKYPITSDSCDDN